MVKALLIPGWGMDARVLASVQLPIPVFYVDQVDWFTVGQYDSFFVEAEANSVLVVGFSLGAYVATALAQKWPEKVKRLMLIGAASHYPLPVLKKIKQLLVRSKEGYLQSFYQACFSSENQWSVFMNDIGNAYLSALSLEHLLESLDFLGAQKLEGSQFWRIAEKTTFMHGIYDTIAEIAFVKEFSHSIGASFCSLYSGHVPFFDRQSLLTIQEFCMVNLPLE